MVKSFYLKIKLVTDKLLKMKKFLSFVFFVVLLSSYAEAQTFRQKVGSWARNNAPRQLKKFTVGYVIDRTVTYPLQRRYERQGYYIPKRPPGIPGKFRPAYMILTRAQTAYSY